MKRDVAMNDCLWGSHPLLERPQSRDDDFLESMYKGYSLKLLKRCYMGDYCRVIEGDIRSSDYSSYGPQVYGNTQVLLKEITCRAQSWGFRGLGFQLLSNVCLCLQTLNPKP